MVGWKVTIELSGKVTTLAVEIPVGSVTAPELSEITVCPRELVVVTIPGIVEEPGVVVEEPGVIEEEPGGIEEDPGGTLLLLTGGTTAVLLAGEIVAVELLVRVTIDVLLLAGGTTVMLVEVDSVVGMLVVIVVTQVVVVPVVCTGADEVE